MKIIKPLLLLLIALSLNTVNAQEKETKLPKEYPFGAPGSESRGVFGEDGRHEVNDVSGITHYTKATAVMIPKSSVDGNKVYGYSLRQSLTMQFGIDRFDENVKFLDQPTVANCTGFLVAPQIIVTAGHCINSIEDANDWYWLFDYTNNMKWNLEGNYVTIDRNNLYEVIEVLGSKFEGDNDDELEDYAVLKLNRTVNDRKPYRIRTSGTPSARTNVYTIGSPTGLPLKISLNSEILDEGNDYWFKTNIDAFPGNSGGPVFDPNGFIEGILVRGAVEYTNGRYTGDYKYNQYCDCIQTVTFEQAGLTAGCQIHKINSIPFYLIKRIIYDNLERAIRKNNNDEYDRWADYEWIFYDSFTMDRGSFESLAMDNSNNYALDKLITINAERYDSKYARNILEYALSSGSSVLKENTLENLDIDAVDKYDQTLLEKYTIDNNLRLVSLLMEYGANSNIEDHYGNNLLHIAVKNDSYSIINYLINKNGMDLDARDENGQTLLELYVTNNNIDLVKKLIENGADSSIKDRNGNNLLHIAAQNDAYNIISYLMSRNSMDLDARNENGQTLLELYVTNNKIDLVKELIENGADSSTSNSKGNNLLHIAARYGSSELINLLLKKGVKANRKNEDGRLPEKVAKKAKRKDIAKQLKKARKRR